MSDRPSDDFKKDAGKPRMELIDPTAAEDLARVLTMGAAKYTANGWRDGIDREDGDERIMGALLRHAMAILRGEIFDEESGLPHAAHIQCNAMFLTWFARERSRREENAAHAGLTERGLDKPFPPEAMAMMGRAVANTFPATPEELAAGPDEGC